MAVTFVISEEGDGGRAFTVDCSKSLVSGPVLENGVVVQRGRRKVLTFHVKSDSVVYQAKARINKPDSGWQTWWKGEGHPNGPKDGMYMVDDAASEYNQVLVREDGSGVEWEFTPTDREGNPTP